MTYEGTNYYFFQSVERVKKTKRPSHFYFFLNKPHQKIYHYTQMLFLAYN